MSGRPIKRTLRDGLRSRGAGRATLTWRGSSRIERPRKVRLMEPRSGQCWSSLPSNLRPCRLRYSSSFSRSLAG